MPNRDTRRSRAYRLAETHIRDQHGEPNLMGYIASLRRMDIPWADIAREFDGMPGGGPSIETLRQWYLADQENEQ
jgi:hypothetical protein